ncbi:MAG TPA: class I SAM-dependent methyltransferase [Thermoleophilaceae bacterium]|jgi:SAM-dependent methyltransferase
MSIELDFQRLTDDRWWDDYWQGTKLPQAIDHGQTSYIDELLGTLDRNLPPGAGRSALEIGGAPGRYLAYVHRRLGYSAKALEYSRVGYELIKRNLELLGVEAQAWHGDMFDPAIEIEPSDVVYSLGLIEHFDDPAAVAEAHLRFLKPGGILVIGAPNLFGASRFLYQRLSPSILESHHAPSTHPDAWAPFERRFGLEVLHKAYLGGFEPANFARLESQRLPDRVLWRLLRWATIATNSRAVRPLHRLNHRWWSAYLLAVYRAPA